MENNDWPVEELERLREDMHNEKFNAGLYFSATIVMCATTILIWIKTTFYECIPMGVITILFLQLAYSKWKCSCVLKSYLNIIDSTKEILTKIDQELDKKKGESHG